MIRTNLLRALVAGALLGLGAPIVAPIPTAHATTIAPLTIEQMTDGATWIVRGVVTETWTEIDTRGHVWTRARVQVGDVLKGPEATTELIVDTLGGEYAGETTWVEGAARFSADEEVLMFLDTIRHGERLTPLGMFTGKYTIRRAPGDERRYAQRYPVNPRLAYDARFLPHPDAADRVYVDDLEARIQAHLAAEWDGKPIAGLPVEKLQVINTPDRRHR